MGFTTKITKLWKDQKYMLDTPLFVSVLEYIKGSECRTAETTTKKVCQPDIVGCGSKTNFQHLFTVQ